jgi:hypothetical protein
MILHLTSGEDVCVDMAAATMGLNLRAITLETADMHKLCLLDKDGLKERIGVLYTQFAPAKLKEKNT